MPDELGLDPDTDQRPSRIGDRFEVDRLLARGGMAAVYLAHQVDVGRPVALKVLRPPDEAENVDDFEDRFRTEARALAALNHPNIVTLYDFGRLPDGRCYLAMEYIDGPRLADELRAGPLPAEKVVPWLLNVARAVRYAHNNGIIHRDLKPSNLILRRDADGTETIKVVDFGLVKLTDADQSLTRDGNVLGSPHCMSPEQVRGMEVDARTDLYAIGVLLFRSLTGRYPFHGKTPAGTMMAHVNEPVPTFFSVDPKLNVPPGLEAVVRRCLEKDPQRRYPDADALIADLRRFVDPVQDATRTGTFTRSMVVDDLQRPAAVERGLFALAISLAVVGLALVALVWSRGKDAGVEADAPPAGAIAPQLGGGEASPPAVAPSGRDLPESEPSGSEAKAAEPPGSPPVAATPAAPPAAEARTAPPTPGAATPAPAARAPAARVTASPPKSPSAPAPQAKPPGAAASPAQVAAPPPAAPPPPTDAPEGYQAVPDDL